ncbi:Pkinase-domain-containing protein [Pluteus cervinus]|uniref:Pkinase-domain-containing protein n=1 Tax=Pluteus cervinus TaxID=181527 RepID=A0ACD3B215_9AGAR|nr:Pkinase-domain-containing protein [Pluteus cervinus]
MSQTRGSPRRASRRRAGHAQSKDDADKSTSPLPSPGSWNVDRGRSRVRRSSNPFSEENLRRRGYHSLLSSFGKVFHVERRWKLIREMGSGAYGVVISAADEISGEAVAIKLVTRIFDKVQLAKRALREITLLRHFANHENITGLIDVDAISPDFNEIYIFMEPMEADLHQIIKSGQTLTNEHVQYFLYQILRGMKYIHSASVIHRDLKPGNLLVNADCELKICDFGLSRGFDSTPDENASHLTEYVATRWYRAPEIMLAFRRYSTAIDMWSIGCILAELLLGKPLFKGKDYVDQLNKVLDVLGTPSEEVIRKIGSDKAQAYVQSLPFKKTVPFRNILPTADLLAIDLLTKMLTFDPGNRITVPQALEHPWLASYHDETDEPDCPEIFDKWRQIEEFETLDQYREALWNEIEDYRREVRGISIELTGFPVRKLNASTLSDSYSNTSKDFGTEPLQDPPLIVEDITDTFLESASIPEEEEETDLTERITSIAIQETQKPSRPISPEQSRFPAAIPTDPVVTYARRSSIMQPSRQNSTFNSPVPSAHYPAGITEGTVYAEPSVLGSGSIAFPTQGYVVPARSRTGSTVGGEVMTRKLLRTLSTVSIHESAEGLAGGLGQIAPIGKFIMERDTTEADAPPSEMVRDFGMEDEEEVSVHRTGDT